MRNKRKTTDALPRTRKPEIALAGLSVLVAATICGTRIEALWYPRNYFDMLLAVILGLAVTVIGVVGVILSEPRRTRLYGEEPRTARNVSLLWAERLSAIVAAVGATIAFAGILDLFGGRRFPHTFDILEWIVALGLAALGVGLVVQSMRQARVSKQ